jgi:hypothetical protein
MNQWNGLPIICVMPNTSMTAVSVAIIAATGRLGRIPFPRHAPEVPAQTLVYSINAIAAPAHPSIGRTVMPPSGRGDNLRGVSA